MKKYGAILHPETEEVKIISLRFREPFDRFKRVMIESAPLYSRKTVMTIQEQEFYHAIETYGDTVTRILLLRCRNMADAEDCFQNVFLKLLTSRTEFREPEHMKAWLLRCAIREAADMNRRFWRKKVQLMGDTPFPEAEAPKNDALAVLEALRALPDHQREVLYLRCFEGYSERETARILNISPGTVKSRLNRARAALRTTLLEEQLCI